MTIYCTLPSETPTRSYKDRISSLEMAEYTLRRSAQFKEIAGQNRRAGTPQTIAGTLSYGCWRGWHRDIQITLPRDNTALRTLAHGQRYSSPHRASQVFLKHTLLFSAQWSDARRGHAWSTALVPEKQPRGPEVALHLVSWSPAWLLKVKDLLWEGEEGGRNRTAPFKASELGLAVLPDFILRLCNPTAAKLLPDQSWPCRQRSCARVTFLLNQ